MQRAIFMVILFPSFIFGGWCIQYAAQKRIYEKEDKLFLQEFPNGFICHHNGLYRFLSGIYKTKKEAIYHLKLARKRYPQAFLKRCRAIQCKEGVNHAQVGQGKKSEKKISSLKKEKNIEHEDQFIQKVMAKAKKKRESAYTLGFYEYLARLFHRNYRAKNIDYSQRLAKIEALIEDSRYDWDIYGNVALRYSKFIDYDLTTDKEFISDVGIHLKKRLFDGAVMERKRVLHLKNRLAHLKYLTAKDKLSLYGLAIYTQALLAQRLKDLFEQEYFNQKNFYYLIKERVKAGIASKVDEIDAKNDLLELKKDLLLKLYAYLYSDYLLRNSIELDIQRPLALQNIGFVLDEGGLEKLYKKAYEHNKRVAQERTLYALKKVEMKNSQRAFLPIIDFSGSLFYEYKKNFTAVPNKSVHGLNYSAELIMKIPFYSGEAKSEYIQRAKLNAVIQKNSMLYTMQEIAKDIHKLYNENSRLAKHLQIVEQQLSLMQEKMYLVKERYLNGLAQYRDFTEALRNYLKYEEEREIIKQQMIQNSAQLHILIGKQIFYGEN